MSWYVAESLREARNRACLTPDDVERKTKGKVKASQLERWERGDDTDLSLEHLELLASLYGCPVGWFFLERLPDPLRLANPPLTIAEYVRITQETAFFPDEPLPFLYPALGLAGEVGEVVEQVKKAWRDGKKPNLRRLEEELGDVLWYWASLVRSLGLDPDRIARRNIIKLRRRYCLSPPESDA